jgi:hypothetical protein
MDDLKTGTATYMGLYPEKSTDGGERTNLYQLRDCVTVGCRFLGLKNYGPSLTLTFP